MISNGVDRYLKSVVRGKVLSIVLKVEEPGNGFEAWRRLYLEYRPRHAGRKVTMLEAVLHDAPQAGEDFGAQVKSGTWEISSHLSR